MAPEQLQGRVDQRADLFSLGVVLWESLTGAKLFYSSADADTLQKLLHLDPPSVSQTRPEVPKRIDRILKRALAKDVKQRYRSAREFRADLLKAVAPDTLEQLRASVDIDAVCLGKGVDTGPGEPGPEASLLTPVVAAGPIGPRRWSRVAIGLVLVLGLGAGIWLGRRLLHSAGEERPDSGLAAASPVDSISSQVADVGLQPSDPTPEPVAATPPKPVPQQPRPPVKLTRKTVEKLVRKHGAKLQTCAETHLGQGGGAGDVELVVDFSINASGRVEKVRLAPREIERTDFGRCLTGHILRLKFPRHRDPSVTIAFPLKFQVLGKP